MEEKMGKDSASYKEAPPMKGETTRANLSTLPVETILEITSYLSPASKMALNYTCRRLCFGLDLSAKAVVASLEDVPRSEQTFFSTSNKRSRRVDCERLELLCMLNRDRLFGCNKTVCSRCVTAHDDTSFGRRALWLSDYSQYSQQSLRTGKQERVCRGLSWKAFLCPHAFLDTDGIGYYPSASELETEQPPRRGPGLHAGFVCKECKIPVRVTESVICHTNFPILKLDLSDVHGQEPKDYVPNKATVARKIRSYAAPICPHLRLGSTEVLQAFNQDCKKLRGKVAQDCSCTICTGDATECSICHAVIAFEGKMLTSISWLLSVNVTRNLQPTKNATDPLWISQLTQHSKYVNNKNAWTATEKMCPWPTPMHKREYLAR